MIGVVAFSPLMFRCGWMCRWLGVRRRAGLWHAMANCDQDVCVLLFAVHVIISVDLWRILPPENWKGLFQFRIDIDFGFHMHIIISYIYLHNWAIDGINVGKYSSTMEHMAMQSRCHFCYLPWRWGLQQKQIWGSTMMLAGNDPRVKKYKKMW